MDVSTPGDSQGVAVIVLLSVGSGNPNACCIRPERERCSIVAAACSQHTRTAQLQWVSSWMVLFSIQSASVTSHWCPDGSMTEAVISTSPVSRVSAWHRVTCRARAILRPVMVTLLANVLFQSSDSK